MKTIDLSLERRRNKPRFSISLHAVERYRRRFYPWARGKDNAGITRLINIACRTGVITFSRRSGEITNGEFIAKLRRDFDKNIWVVTTVWRKGN